MSPTTLLSRIGYKNQKKMQTKALNTDVLNNSTPTDNKPALQLLSSSLPAQILASEFNQDQGHPAPPAVPPRSILQSPSSPDLSRSSLSQAGTGEVSLPGAPSLHTHSSKFPIEREVIVKSSNGKQCKIPNLSDYMRRAKPSVAPDAPPKQVAWTHSVNKSDGENAGGPVQGIAAHQIYKAQPMSVMNSTKDSEPSPIRPSNSLDFGPTTSTPEDGSRGLPQRTYQSLKEMISSRFTKQNGAPVSPNLDTTLSPQSQLRQHGVYIGTPQSSNQQSSQLELRRMRMPIQQQRGFDQQPRIHFQPPNQQLLNTPQMPYKYHHPQSGQQPLSGGPGQCTSYQTVSETQTFWKPYDEEEGIFRNQQNDDAALGGCPPGSASPNEGLGAVNHNQECLPADSYSSCDQRYKQNCRPPMNQQQQYRSGPSQPLIQNQAIRSSGVPLYQTSQNHNDYSSHPSQFSQSSVIVHAPQDGLLKEDKQQGHVKSVELIHREGPQGAAVLAGPSIKEDEDDGGLMKTGLQSDSGRGSTVYSSAKTSTEDTTPPLGETSEWSERVENELRQILNGPVNGVTTGGGTLNGGGGLTSATGQNLGSSESFSSVSPPLPPLSPHSSDDTYQRPRNGGYGIKGGSNALWSARTKERKKAHKHGKSSSNLLCGGLEIDSMVDENNSSEDEDYTDTRAIRKQLEGLETMYSQVLKLLGVRKHNLPRYEASDPRINKRRTCGSVSSVPSSVSSRPLRATDRRGRAGKVRDVRGVNKRFQRLESHVVTLARSVAHLSSEMRTQHIMMQEMEMMRGELAALRIQSNMNQQAAHQVSMQQAASYLGGPSGVAGGNAGLNTTKQINSTPEKVKRLTKFFGDEPPLLRLFLRRLGYEKYASLFEKERIGLLELPFMSEERLVKLGIPLGPRLRIMQQAHLANPNTLCVL